ncbi:pyridoxal phosphate-dependent aminotransferase [Brooklawnia cerclae]|uniref:N-succinyldiaminopimelate aminotransferase n=1 Tax=Brooklawnia cerclae TaxID=349934 RepID=A0ABX0SH42_9ACTN|nr:aminotransferase class I/II-fold pyridoxal phosphate-dependent enzyme [Brooklawnia cerclae]NIH56648.1 N-succinyldiaminopimelate aminotransferase [Brooklawnia cerclae]
MSSSLSSGLGTRPSLDGPWQRTADFAGLLGPDGRPSTTIFTEMTLLARQFDAVNLGQGFPDEDGPRQVLDAAKAAIDSGVNQYSPGRGEPDLRAAISEHQRRFYGLDADPDTEVLVTAGATEALAATVLALVRPGDEVVTFEPFYDAYAADIGLAGGRHVTVALRAPDFQPDLDELDHAVTDRTRLIIVNDPNNPTGAVFTRETLQRIVEVAERHNAWIVTDEVYEHLVFDDARHIPIATLPGACERTITISSAGKTFSATGWKIGWAVGPAEVITAILTVKQYLTFVNGAPFQPAIAAGLRLGDDFYTGIASVLRRKRDILVDGLQQAGFRTFSPKGAYYVLADTSSVGYEDATELSRELPRKVGVAGVPASAFAKPEHAEAYRSLLRFAFCKREDVLREAASRLTRL